MIARRVVLALAFLVVASCRSRSSDGGHHDATERFNESKQSTMGKR